jgi:hypothetical protein
MKLRETREGLKCEARESEGLGTMQIFYGGKISLGRYKFILI